MPDLTIIAVWVCSTNESWSTAVKGSKGQTYIVRFGRDYSPNRQYEYDYTCTCKSFEYRGTCKHIKAVRSQRCGWHGQFDAGEPVEVPVSDEYPNGYACPRCGGPLHAVNVGV